MNNPTTAEFVYDELVKEKQKLVDIARTHCVSEVCNDNVHTFTFMDGSRVEIEYNTGFPCNYYRVRTRLK
jgi:hypothetical protein